MTEKTADQTETKTTDQIADEQPLDGLFADELPEGLEADAGEKSETEKETETESTEETEESKDTKETEETEDDDSTPESKPKDEKWHLKAVLDEREKRQAAQKELEELKSKLAEQEKGDEKKVSVFEDEEGFTNQLLTKVEQDRLNDKLNMSQALAEREFGKAKVAEKLEAFKTMAQEDPSLAAKVREAALPYHELVSLVDRHEEAKQMENLDEYKDKLRAELRAELEKEIKEKQEADDEKRESITPSLASKRSAGGNKEPVKEIGLEDVLSD